VPPGRLQIRLGRYGRFIGCSRYAEEDGGCRYIRNLNGEERPEPELLDETCPECGRQLQRRVGRFGPFVGCSGYPECRYIKREPAKRTGVTCPQCGQGELVEKRTRFGPFWGCDRYPECDMGVSNPPDAEHPCPECGSVLLQRPKSYRCWNCGCELDTAFEVKKHGDPKAEAEARAAKAAARAARRNNGAKRTAANDRTTANKGGSARKRRTSKASTRKGKGSTVSSEAEPAPTEG
jgi:DNA topoisomerase-1